MDRSVRRHNTDPSYISKSSSRRSDDSYTSHSTAPTSLHISPRPSLQHAATVDARHRSTRYYEKASPVISSHARSSSSTFASTTDNLFAEPEEYEDFEYQTPAERPSHAVSNARASTPHDFADYFPSQRRLDIRHDDTTEDGNMNLRVDTEVTEGGYRTRVQLFHLRMHDLQARQFSLRRYCRDSGREVCHASQRHQKSGSEKPGIHRSMSNAFASLRARPDFKRTNSGGSLRSSPRRTDSGYGSDDEDEQDDSDSFMSSSQSSKSSSSPPHPADRIKLEFSNYAQVEVRRRGAKRNKRYEFEFWGHTYVWKRMSSQVGASRSISYHLLRADTGHPVAHLCPELRSSRQMQAEAEAGGWIPSCSMWISDEEVLSAMTDVADVIVATGLMALVDDCIERHFRPKIHKRQISVPLTPLKMEYVGPKALVEHVFRRRNSADDAKEKARERDSHVQAHGQSPLRRQVAAS